MCLHYVIGLDQSVLAKEIYETQKLLNFPSLVSESRELITHYDLPNIIDQNIATSKQKWRSLVKQAIGGKYAEELKSKFSCSKLKNGLFKDENFDIKDYINQLSLTDARTNFRRRSNMRNCQMNQRNNPV